MQPPKGPVAVCRHCATNKIQQTRALETVEHILTEQRKTEQEDKQRVKARQIFAGR